MENAKKSGWRAGDGRSIWQEIDDRRDAGPEHPSETLLTNWAEARKLWPDVVSNPDYVGETWLGFDSPQGGWVTLQLAGIKPDKLEGWIDNTQVPPQKVIDLIKDSFHPLATHRVLANLKWVSWASRYLNPLPLTTCGTCGLVGDHQTERCPETYCRLCEAAMPGGRYEHPGHTPPK